MDTPNAPRLSPRFLPLYCLAELEPQILNVPTETPQLTVFRVTIGTRYAPHINLPIHDSIGAGL